MESIADYFSVRELFDSLLTHVEDKDLVNLVCRSQCFKTRNLPKLYEHIPLYLYPWDDFPRQP
jgi:hypothetical protein